MKRALPLSYIQGNPRNQFSIWADFQFSKFLETARTRLSVDRSVDRPRHRSTVPVDRAGRPRVGHFQSVDRAVDRSPSAVDRAVDRYSLVHVGAQRSTGPVDHAAAAASLLLLLLNLWILVILDFLDFLSSSYTLMTRCNYSLSLLQIHQS